MFSKVRITILFGAAAAFLMALVLLAAPAKANAVVASASGGSQLKIHNMFGLELIDVRVYSFNANQHADGRVTGQYEHRSFDDGQPFFVRGPLTCLNVIGNRAWVGGLIEASSEPSLVGWDMWFQVQDNGEGKGSLPDWTTLVGASPEAGAAKAYCDEAPEVRFPFDIEHGNITVQ